MEAAEIIAQNREIVKRALACLTDKSLTPHERFDLAEFMLAQLPQVSLPTFHHFGDGIYAREVSHPMGSVLTSVMHLCRHPFFLLKGKIAVFWIDETGKAFDCVLAAPTYTMTAPGTRRIVVALEDTNAVAVWPTELTDPVAIMESVTSDKENPLLDEDFVPAWRRESPQPAIA